MARCPDCRVYLEDTLWEEIRKFFFNFFTQNIQDLREEMYTKGISDGYKQGFQQAVDYHNKHAQRLKTEGN